MMKDCVTAGYTFPWQNFDSRILEKLRLYFPFLIVSEMQTVSGIMLSPRLDSCNLMRSPRLEPGNMRSPRLEPLPKKQIGGNMDQKLYLTSPRLESPNKEKDHKGHLISPRLESLNKEKDIKMNLISPRLESLNKEKDIKMNLISPRLESLPVSSIPGSSKLALLPLTMTLESPRLLPEISSHTTGISEIVTQGSDIDDIQQDFNQMHIINLQFQVMPIIILNLGGELVYILNRRLRDQNAPPDAIKKVLQDLLAAMLSKQFITALFKPQNLHSYEDTEELFLSLLESTPMRLNKASMTALLDVMLMSFKHQVVKCISPQQYLHITENHLESLRVLVESPLIDTLVQSTTDRLLTLYSRLSNGEWMNLKTFVFKYLENKRKAVTLLLNHKQQSPDGVLLLQNSGKMTVGSEPPGTIRYYTGGKIVKTSTFDTVLSDVCTVHDELFDDESTLGLNLWDNEPSQEPQKPINKRRAMNKALKGPKDAKKARERLKSMLFKLGDERKSILESSRSI
eukprot:gene10820-22570_t